MRSISSSLLDKKNHALAQRKHFSVIMYRILIKCCSPFVKRLSSDYTEGNWYGNHTISKTITDLNKIVFYADKNGKLNEIPQRKMLIISDMIISGEKEGPLMPSPKKVGIIASGTDPIVFDEAICTLMGFDPRKIPTLQVIYDNNKKYALHSNNIEPCFRSNSKLYDGVRPSELDRSACLNFIPPSGWRNHIETRSSE